jgi:hypothetical protein
VKSLRYLFSIEINFSIQCYLRPLPLARGKLFPGSSWPCVLRRSFTMKFFGHMFPREIKGSMRCYMRPPPRVLEGMLPFKDT